jgi:hypothetical protein
LGRGGFDRIAISGWPKKFVEEEDRQHVMMLRLKMSSPSKTHSEPKGDSVVHCKRTRSISARMLSMVAVYPAPSNTVEPAPSISMNPFGSLRFRERWMRQPSFAARWRARRCKSQGKRGSPVRGYVRHWPPIDAIACVRLSDNFVSVRLPSTTWWNAERTPRAPKVIGIPVPWRMLTLPRLPSAQGLDPLQASLGHLDP